MSQIFVIEETAETWQEALRQTAQKLLEMNCVKPDFYASCAAREESFPTGLTASCPIAIPHTSKEYVLQQAVCVLRLEHPVKFRSMENVDLQVDVRYVMNLALQDDQEHIRIVSQIIRNLKDKHFIEAMDALDAESLSQFLNVKFLKEGNEKEWE